MCANLTILANPCPQKICAILSCGENTVESTGKITRLITGQIRSYPGAILRAIQRRRYSLKNGEGASSGLCQLWRRSGHDNEEEGLKSWARRSLEAEDIAGGTALETRVQQAFSTGVRRGGCIARMPVVG